MSCESSTENFNCKISEVKSGYTTANETTYYNDVFISKKDDGIITVDNFNYDKNTDEIQGEYHFDEKNRPIKVILRNLTDIYANGLTYEEHSIYTYSNNLVINHSYTISSENDTIYTGQPYKYLYITEPDEKKVYRYSFEWGNDTIKNSYTFKDGNLFKIGSFDVIENDTIDTFIGEFVHDNHPNTFFIPEYNALILHEYLEFYFNSKNNCIGIAPYDNQYNTFNYYFNFDEKGNLTRYVGKSGLTVDITYACD